jgi:hypothetical protein
MNRFKYGMQYGVSFDIGMLPKHDREQMDGWLSGMIHVIDQRAEELRKMMRKAAGVKP